MFCAVTKIHCSYKETLQLQRNIILFLAWLYKYLYSWILLKYRVVVSLFIINFIIRIIVNDKFFIVKKVLCPKFPKFHIYPDPQSSHNPSIHHRNIQDFDILDGYWPIIISCNLIVCGRGFHRNFLRASCTQELFFQNLAVKISFWLERRNYLIVRVQRVTKV